MKNKTINYRLIKYEFLNTLGNLFIFIFGVLFPTFLSIIMSKAYSIEIEPHLVKPFNTQMFISIMFIMPMATILIGHAVNFSEEIEKDINLRMNLFGITQREILISKMIASFIFLTFSLIFYITVDILLLDLIAPSFKVSIVLIIIMYLLSIVFFMLAHGIALIFKKFGPSFSVTMGVYFLFLILSGMMGIPINKLPPFLQTLSKALPTSYLASDYIYYWMNEPFKFGPLLLSFTIFTTLSLLVFIIGIYKNKRQKLS